MNEYITIIEASVRWRISVRRIQILCNSGRIDGALKQAGVWIIPNDCRKPIDKRKKTLYSLEKSKLSVLSLFSGCGGMDLGFEGDFDVMKESVNTIVNPHWNITPVDNIWVHLPKTRFSTVFANDIREDAQTAWTKYFGKKGVSSSIYCLDSIVDLVKLHKENGVKVFPNNIDLVTGGFPCQDFSISGKRLGFDSNKSHDGKVIEDTESVNIENRGQLYIWMREVISITKPKVFIAENVKGLVNLADVKSIIENDFSTISENGYLVVSAKVLHSADYGVPQSRERVFFIGFKKSALTKKALEALSQNQIPEEYDPYPPITHSYTKFDSNLLQPVSLHLTFRGLLEPDLSSDLSQQKYSKAKYMGKHCQGQTEIKMDGIGPTIRSEHHGNIEFRRLSIANGGKNIKELNNGLDERRLTVRECARIQTFPDDYEFVIPKNKKYYSISPSSAYKIIGNAVPPLLAFNIAMRLELLWENYFGGNENANIK